MLKNCVFNVDVNTMKWAQAASIRAVKTMAQAALGVIGASVTMGGVNWQMVVSASVLAGVVSILTSVTGIPEVSANEREDK